MKILKCDICQGEINVNSCDLLASSGLGNQAYIMWELSTRETETCANCKRTLENAVAATLAVLSRKKVLAHV